MQKLCCVRTIQQPLPVWIIVTSLPTHISINSHPFLVGIVSKLCGWLLDWNTNDGGFGHCFLVLTWDLSCHAHNTANIRLCEIEWGSTFDVFEIYFAHTKTDQTGDEAKYSCHLYANPCCPLICPVLSWHFIFPVVVTYHRVGSPSCSWDGTSIKGFRRCYFISFGIPRQRCLSWG